MPNIATIFKQKIARISRKEARGEIEAAQRASAAFRKDIGAMRHRIDVLERQVARLGKQPRETTPSENEAGKALHFRSAGWKLTGSALGFRAEKWGS